ncbi:L-histidine N(alpha)-methyltransferase [Beggiatoa alba]|nr:L-histidine N(alpha)-methyltransferase [Beggiatoa alba]
MKPSVATSIQFYDYHPKPADFFAEVIEGLSKQQKKIPPKFFYDQKGSEIFEEICATPEYYPTRTEQSILQENAEEIADIIGHHCLLVEPGSGNCEKVRLLLDTLKPQAYVPMDISKDHLKKAAQALSADYPWLDIHAACVDFTEPMDLSFCPTDMQKIAFFPGSSIGNFEPHAAIQFMSQVADSVGHGGGMLIGVDLKKEKQILDAAYNDKAGVTAAFNLNLLDRINQELDADFIINNFEHHAFYNSDKGRIEMHLRSQQDQVINIEDLTIRFDKGETIHTENSYKYTINEFQAMAEKAGFTPVNVWTDLNALFSVHYFEVPAC